MFDILTAIYYSELTDLRGKSPMKQPYTIAEERVMHQLRALDSETAGNLQRAIRALAVEQRDAAFTSGVRFGAQLMAQLLDGF